MTAKRAHLDRVPDLIPSESGDSDYYNSKEFEHLIKNAPSFSDRINPPNLTDRITEISNSKNCTQVTLVFETEEARVFKTLKKTGCRRLDESNG